MCQTGAIIGMGGMGIRHFEALKNANIKELRGKKTIYEISTNYSINNINLRLESKSLRLIKSESSSNLYKVESY